MALNTNLITLQQVSGGLSNPAPAFYSIYYDGALADWKDKPSVSAYCAKVGIAVGDGFILRAKTVTGSEKNHNLGYFGGAANAIGLTIFSIEDLS